MLDTNLVVAATRRLPAVSPSLRLLAALVEGPNVDLVANPVLLREWRRNAGPSLTAQEIVETLAARCRVVWPNPAALRATKPHFQSGSAADWLHAATCLDTGAILVSNDRDFSALAGSALVEVWTASRLLGHIGL